MPFVWRIRTLPISLSGQAAPLRLRLFVAQEATKVGALVLQDDGQFKIAVNDRLWQLLPLPLRVVGRERLRFDSVLLGARQHLFVVDGDVVRLRPDARERLQATLADVFR